MLQHPRAFLHEHGIWTLVQMLINVGIFEPSPTGSISHLLSGGNGVCCLCYNGLLAFFMNSWFSSVKVGTSLELMSKMLACLLVLSIWGCTEESPSLRCLWCSIDITDTLFIIGQNSHKFVKIMNCFLWGINVYFHNFKCLFTVNLFSVFHI